MSDKRSPRTSKTLSGLIREPIPASIFTTGIVLTYAYATGYIFSIGDPRQLTPVLTGLIVGSILFSLIGFAVSPTRIGLLSLTVLSSIFLIVAYVIIFLNSLVLNNTNLLLVAFLMSTPAMPVSQLVGRLSSHFSIGRRLLFGSVEGVLIIVLVFAFALEYEMNGQINFYLGPLLFLSISLVYLVLDKRF